MIKNVIQAITNVSDIVFITGYDVSKISDVPNIRSVNKIYKGHTYAEIMSHNCFQNNKELFYEFYRNVVLSKEYNPNIVHKFIAELQRKKSITVITENIDGLHRVAGTIKTIELYGTLNKNYCLECFEEYPSNAILYSKSIPKCMCGGIIKPSIVLCGEPINGNTIIDAVTALQNAELLIICGTNLNINPTSYLLNFYHGDKVIEINQEKNSISNQRTNVEVIGNLENIFSELSLDLHLIS